MNEEKPDVTVWGADPIAGMSGEEVMTAIQSVALCMEINQQAQIAQARSPKTLAWVRENWKHYECVLENLYARLGEVV